jgi:hypothetical protein
MTKLEVLKRYVDQTDLAIRFANSRIEITEQFLISCSEEKFNDFRTQIWYEFRSKDFEKLVDNLLEERKIWDTARRINIANDFRKVLKET